MRVGSLEEYETVIEQEKAEFQQDMKETKKQFELLKTKAAKLEVDKIQQKKEIRELERDLEKMQSALEKAKANNGRIVQLELQNEELLNENRNVGFMYEDLEMKFDS